MHADSVLHKGHLRLCWWRGCAVSCGQFQAVAEWRLLCNVFFVCLLWNPKDTLGPLSAHPPGCHCQILDPIDYSREFSSDMETHLCAAWMWALLYVPGSGHGHLLCLWAGSTLWSCLEAWGVQGLFLSHSNAVSFQWHCLLVCTQLISLRWFISLLQSSFSSGDVFMGLSFIWCSLSAKYQIVSSVHASFFFTRKLIKYFPFPGL